MKRYPHQHSDREEISSDSSHKSPSEAKRGCKRTLILSCRHITGSSISLLHLPVQTSGFVLTSNSKSILRIATEHVATLHVAMRSTVKRRVRSVLHLAVFQDRVVSAIAFDNVVMTRESRRTTRRGRGSGDT
jgi:hypothetical protein